MRRRCRRDIARSDGRKVLASPLIAIMTFLLNEVIWHRFETMVQSVNNNELYLKGFIIYHL